MARALAERDGPFLFFDSGRGAGESSIFHQPVAIWSGAVEELAGWLQDQTSRGLFVAGFLGFELSWDLDEIRAERRASRFPDVWVGAFERRWGHDGASWLDGAPIVEAAGAGAERRLQRTDWSVSLDVTAKEYRDNVAAAVEAIYAGELFEVNYTERFRAPSTLTDFELYERLRDRSTGSFFGFAKLDDFSIASVSPEEFLRVDGALVSTYPIKGTRRRGDDAAQDLEARRELLESEKDRAENVMIVDLMRNDLTRYCRPGTVQATLICDLETFAGWHHLVSTVEGELDDGVMPTDILVGCFPPGSITGAPKLRSIELITELEASARGPYTGTMFWADATTLRSSVLIRTAAIRNGLAEYGAGGAVVADSDPELEYEEALLKAAPFLGLGDVDGS